MESANTIYARASAAGRAGVAVYRLSGAKVQAIARALLQKVLEPRVASLQMVKSSNGQTLDQGLALYFPGPHSFTGEDVLELHLHGSRAVELALYERLSTLGARLAEPGEFTLRALKNGKLDLTQVEGLSDLLDAQTDRQRAQALGQLGGGITELAVEWRDDLLSIMASLTADIDFDDEGDVPASIANAARPRIEQLVLSLQRSRERSATARLIRDGVMIALIGSPNAGKSSLLNRLAGSDIAIVSDKPGTTRDIVEARLDIAGMVVTLADTAGLRKIADDEIEMEGMARTRLKAGVSDLRFLVVDPSAPSDVSRETISHYQAGDFILVNKADLNLTGPRFNAPDEAMFYVSAKTGEGIEALLSALTEQLASTDTDQGRGLLSRQRHLDNVDRAILCLRRASTNLEMHPELAAEDLRVASGAFGQLTGAIGIEDVLGEVFSNFCIGK